MDILQQLKILSEPMGLEPAEDTGCPNIGSRTMPEVYTHAAILPNGKTIKLLKTLMTSACERNCNYCPFRAGRDTRRATLNPEEFARFFMYLHRAGIVEGLFLSSGIIKGGVHSQDKLLDSADILRNKLGFKGYLHLKLMPGSEYAQVEQAMRLSDRVSLNLEAPNPARLEMLAPRKVFVEELIQPLRWVEEIRRKQPSYYGWNHRWPTTTTQFVVGGVDEQDIEILKTTEYLNHTVGLKRAYFSAFTPHPNTPLENHPPTPLERQNRLYQASFLLRDYGFCLEDLPFNASGCLPLDTDPKLAWAEQNLSARPVEVNRADRHELLRVPGIGPRSADAILRLRHTAPIKEIAQLKSLGIQAQRAAPFLLLNGRKPAHQLSLW